MKHNFVIVLQLKQADTFIGRKQVVLICVSMGCPRSQPAPKSPKIMGYICKNICVYPPLNSVTGGTCSFLLRFTSLDAQEPSKALPWIKPLFMFDFNTAWLLPARTSYSVVMLGVRSVPAPFLKHFQITLVLIHGFITKDWSSVILVGKKKKNILIFVDVQINFKKAKSLYGTWRSHPQPGHPNPVSLNV